MSIKETAALGAKIRLEVLGTGFAKEIADNNSGFMEPFNEFALAYCWGSVWSRDGIDRKTRSMLNMAILATLNRPREVETHIRGALRNGCTTDEIRETFMQVAAYVGIPAASDAFRIAQRVIQEEAEAASAKS